MMDGRLQHILSSILFRSKVCCNSISVQGEVAVIHPPFWLVASTQLSLWFCETCWVDCWLYRDRIVIVISLQERIQRISP